MHPRDCLAVDEVPGVIERRRLAEDLDEQLRPVDEVQVQEDARLRENNSEMVKGGQKILREIQKLVGGRIWTRGSASTKNGKSFGVRSQPA